MPYALPETVIQFGTGKFLRAFADLFLHELNQGPSPAGRVAVVQSTGSERTEQFNRQAGCYHVAVRGLNAGQVVDQLLEVHSVARAWAAPSQWEAVLAQGRSPALRAIVSNVTEAGYALVDGDQAVDAPPRSFPAKLLALLQSRFASGLPGVELLPCELLESNAHRLRDLVLEQARRWNAGPALVDWLTGQCGWRNTLVDRIVAAPTADDPQAARDPLMAVAEPFALWAIEGLAWPELAAHPAVVCVDDVRPYSLRKVRILNGAHTALVAKALPLGLTTVRQAVEDERVGPWLDRLLAEEIVPVLEGRVDSPEAFARETLQRFRNPRIEHRLADIALHHEVKLKTRLLPTAVEYRQKFGRVPRLLSEIVRE
jgi:tagaturonate reductase